MFDSLKTVIRSRVPSHKIKRIVKLQSALAILIVFCLYTSISFFLFDPPTVRVYPEEHQFSLLSTDIDRSLKSSIVLAIQEAKEEIVLIIYALSDPAIIQALKSAAEKGVQVTVVFDSVESKDVDALLGKKVHSYPRRDRGLMHMKLLVIDHSIVWLGSANCTTNSLANQGNLVLAIRSALLGKTIESLASVMIEKKAFHDAPICSQSTESTTTLYLHPYHGQLALESLIARIEAAKERVFVAMFTFTHPKLVKALSDAHRRGVDVRVILDKDSSRQTSRKTWGQLKRAGVRCGYRTKPGLLHYKVALIDHQLLAGSCNWTQAGFTTNHEASLFIDPLSFENEQWILRWWNAVEQRSSLAS